MAKVDKELTQAANALIGWFNPQELTKDDAKAVMHKVLAKMFVNQSTDIKVLHDLIDQHQAALQLELSRRIRHVLR